MGAGGGGGGGGRGWPRKSSKVIRGDRLNFTLLRPHPPHPLSPPSWGGVNISAQLLLPRLCRMYTPIPRKRGFKDSSRLYIQHIWAPVTNNLFPFRNQLAYDVILNNIVSLLNITILIKYHINQHVQSSVREFIFFFFQKKTSSSLKRFLETGWLKWYPRPRSGQKIPPLPARKRPLACVSSRDAFLARLKLTEGHISF